MLGTLIALVWANIERDTYVRFAGRLHGRQEQTDQRGDDGNHHEQFDEGEGRPVAMHDDSSR